MQLRIWVHLNWERKPIIIWGFSVSATHFFDVNHKLIGRLQVLVGEEEGVISETAESGLSFTDPNSSSSNHLNSSGCAATVLEMFNFCKMGGCL